MTSTNKITLKATAGIGWNAFQEQLEGAHEAVRRLAISGGRHGILVTRHGQYAYTVVVSPEVPYGMTYERVATEPPELYLPDHTPTTPSAI